MGFGFNNGFDAIAQMAPANYTPNMATGAAQMNPAANNLSTLSGQAPGTFNVATSQNGGSYIGPMAPQLPALSGSQSNAMWSNMSPSYNAWKSGPTYQSDLASAQQFLNSHPQTFNQPAAPAQAPMPSIPGVGAMPAKPTYDAPTLNTSYNPNPYLSGMAGDIRTQVTDMMNQQLAANRSDAIGAGQYGSSRQGIAEGVANAKGQQYLAGQLANLYGGDYTNAMNRNLSQYQSELGAANQRYGIDAGMYGQGLNYNLGLGQLALGNQNAQNNFYTQQRGQDLQQLGLGADLYNMSQNGAWNPFTNYNNILGNYTGFGNSSSTSSQGGGAMGALGGGLGTLQLLNLLSKGS